MNIKPYDFENGKNRTIKKIKRLIAKKNTRIILFAISGALLLAAICIFAIQWNEGVAAGEEAQELLSRSGISPAPSEGIPFPGGNGVYVQPEAPEPTEIGGADSLLTGELSGYSVIARIDIDKIDAHLPVLSQTSAKALKVSVCYYSGPEPGAEGNLVITGHNYRSGAHFGKLDKIKTGETVSLTDINGKTYDYIVYKMELIKPDEPEALSNTSYSRELTLLTCEANGNRRLVVRCRMI